MKSKVYKFLILFAAIFFCWFLWSFDTVSGFLTVDGSGLSSSPFMLEPEVTVNFKEDVSWTALPVQVNGFRFKDTVYAFRYRKLNIKDSSIDPYIHFISKGYQENFEDIWTEVYDKVNGVIEFSSIDATEINNILSDIHGDETFGNLQDVMTEALVLVKDLNEKGIEEDTNARAQSIYDGYMAWMRKFKVKM